MVFEGLQSEINVLETVR